MKKPKKIKHSQTTQKLENRLIATIEKVKSLSEELTGFVNVNYTVKYDNFPNSLLVHCTFDTETNLAQAKVEEVNYQKNLHKLLFKQGIVLKNSSHNLVFILES
ncbi:hypothetical protein WNY51_02255 [Pseudocolwellia sp. AS88]|jgi:hypothetical protein|uniref:hypothetical protein n=1 Tax=Pseudocolwellia TaxID=2848177 RepID=UPI0026F09E71|nr:hypothetical protein [Pseudocolwellia sp. AS88]MDO7084417.1 hypothetical protein [Pseudocolwellia sp. AS88]